MDKSQREYYLREQMRAIKSELGDIEETSEEIDELRDSHKKGQACRLISRRRAFKQLDRLDVPCTPTPPRRA